MNAASLHVLQIIKGLDIGGHNGGAENFGLRLAQQLRAMGVRVSLCSFYRYGTPVEAEWAERLDTEGIQVVFPNVASRLNLAEGVRTLSGFAYKNQVTVVHSHFQVGTLAGIGVKLRNRIPLLRTAHTPLEFGNNLAGRAARLVFVQAVYPFLLNAEVGVSAGLVRALDGRIMARLSGKRARRIYNALNDPTPSVPESQPFAGFAKPGAESPWILTSIGILNPLKRFDTVLQAMPAILEAVPQVYFALVGCGPEESRLRILAERLQIAGRVWFLGQRSDVHAILRHSDVFVQPSQLEALSTVILEAMQNAVPVIASDIPGNHELVEDGVTGRIFPVGDAQALAELIIWMYRNREAGSQYAYNAQSRLGAFTIQSAAEQYLELYHALMAGEHA